MFKKCISTLLVSAMMLGAIPTMAVEASENISENNAVHGYVATNNSEGGFELVGSGKSPVIHIDENDYESVVRAAEDLAVDIESVTNQKATINSDDIITSEEYTTGIEINGNSMKVVLENPVDSDAQCYVAAYDSNGSLSTVIKATEALNEVEHGKTLGFKFDEAVIKPAGGEIKAFVWNKQMEPLTDVQGVMEKNDVNLDGTDIVIGTLGMNGTVDVLAQKGSLDVSKVEGKWESFTIQNIDDTLVIAGSDKRGTVYGIYDLCEKMGVSPWEWWSDVEPAKADALYINLPQGGYTEGEPSVKYRGIFINDEYNLNQWSQALGNGKAMTHETYEKVFELLLRLKANLLWPAMHEYSPAFHSDEENAKLADEYGIVMGSSHCEPLLRNNLGELDSFQDKWEMENPTKTLYKAVKNESGKSVAYYWTDHDNNGNSVDNKEFLEAYWRESVQNNGSYENIYTLGMRGVHDGSFETNMDKATALNEIITVQRKILQEEICDKTGHKLSDIPQVFIPYKDVLSLYNDGSLKIPEDVTIMWTDDNFGYVRQSANETERNNQGGAGLYYHISYYGYPTSYLWLSSTQPGLMREELTKTYDTGSDKIWIMNVGDIKPAEKEIEYFARLARNIDQTRNLDISDIYKENAKRDFNMTDIDAEEYAKIMDEYYALANSKRPEFLRAGDFSMTAYGDEGQRYIDRYNSITERANTLYEKLPESKKASFYELVLYPIRSAKNMAVDYIQTDRANLYQQQGRGAVINKLAKEVNAAVSEIDADISYYNTMLDGKWNKIMNNNPSKLQRCDAHITTNLNPPTVSELDYTEMGIAVDGQTDLSENPTFVLSKYDTYAKFIDIFNTGYGSFEYRVSADKDYIKINKKTGTVYDSDRIYVSLDAENAPDGVSDATITVERLIGSVVADSRDIKVNIRNIADVTQAKTYVEANGYVSIEAEHYSELVNKGEYEWKIEKDFGRSGDTLKIYPSLDSNANENTITSTSAYAEYNVYFENSGTYTLDVYRMPTLNERGNMRFAVGIDNENPTVLKGTSAYTGSSNKSDAWAKGVLCNNEKIQTTVTVSEAGLHTVRLYNIAPGVVIDKMVLTHGTSVPYSYFGAPESYNTTYNKVAVELPQANTTTDPQNNITKIFEPDVMVGKVVKTDNVISTAEIIKLTDKQREVVVAMTSYKADGNMNGITFKKINLIDVDIDTAVTVDFNSTLPDDTASYEITVFDNFTNVNVVAPYKTFGETVTEGENETLGIKTDLSDYEGKKSMVIIADTEITEDITEDHIVYMHGENVDRNSYKFIPFDKVEGVYYIRGNVQSGNVFNEKKSTVINIHPDNNGTVKQSNTWTFDSSLTDNDGANTFLLSGGASNESGKIKLNTTSTGSAKMVYANPVSILSGETVNVEFDIYFGKLIKKTTSYSITDSNNNKIAGMTIGVYDSNFSCIIGGETVTLDNSAISAVLSDLENTALSNTPVHFKNEIDFATGKVNITMSRNGKADVVIAGKIETGILSNISSLQFLTDYNNNERSCYVDNASININTAPQYAITVGAYKATNKNEMVEGAVITLKDKATDTVVEPTNGKYMLCEGDYIITAQANGYRTVEYLLELSPALESKEIKVEMISTEDLEKAQITVKYVDEEGNEIKEAVTPNGTYYVGDSYTVSDSMTADFIVKSSDGKSNLYKFNPSKSQIETELTAQTEIILVFNLSGQYDYYENFDEYVVNESEWNSSGTYPVVADGKLTYTCVGSSSTGAYTTFDAIDCTGKMVKVEADLKFSPKMISGDSQFSIGDSDPTFSSNNINYGIENSTGHIIGIVHKKNSTSLLVNNTPVSTDLIGDWLHIEADIDFVSRKVTVKLTNESGYSEEVKDVSFYSSNTANNIGSLYLRGAGGNGKVEVDNLAITITGEGSPGEESVLNGKSVYAFGDSIVYGHNAPNNAFMNLIANRYGMNLSKYAVNGATVIKSSNDIITQVKKATTTSPDFVVFDGYTNDAYGSAETDDFNSSGSNLDVTQRIGTIQGSSATSFDNTTFCGAFEEILYTMKQKWPDSKIVFVTIHKSGARNFEIQKQLHDLTVEMCDEWGVSVVDMFNDATLDTRDTEQMQKYIIGGEGSHPNVACCEEFYNPMVAAKLVELIES